MERHTQNPTFPNDRREDKRIPLIVSIKEQSRKGITLCLSTDISSKGMAIKRASGEIPEHGEKITLEFNIPGVPSLFQIPGKYLRAISQTDPMSSREIQNGVVIFNETPSPLGQWIEQFSLFENKQPVIT